VAKTAEPSLCQVPVKTAVIAAEGTALVAFTGEMKVADAVITTVASTSLATATATATTAAPLRATAVDSTGTAPASVANALQQRSSVAPAVSGQKLVGQRQRGHELVW
jgi:hypothetical protein